MTSMLQKKNTCLKKVNGNFQLVRNHNYYYQVQQQLFTLKERKFCHFVVCGIDSEKKAHIEKECIYPDANTGEMLYPSWRLSGGFAFCQRFLGDGTQGGALYQCLNLMLMASVFVESSGMKK